MTELSATELHRLLDRLGRAFANDDSPESVYGTTLQLAVELLDAEFSLIAEKDGAGLTRVASRPSDWSDEDGLLEPASIPSVVTSRGVSYFVADRSDVRGVADTESLPKASSFRYSSVLVAPFGDERVLIAGHHGTEAFSESDMDVLRSVATFASAHAEHVDSDGTDSATLATEAAAGMSHDAANFLTVIQGALTLAREEPESEHFDRIERAADRLEELIEDTRTLLESGAHASETAPVDLEDAVMDAWEVERTAESEIVMAQLDPVVADRSRLCQLLENLFRNAVEHAGPDVTVWVGMLSDEQGFYVEDDGPGIEPDERSSVLEFAYSGTDGNTGLGLNIVQRIAAAHGWDISITQGAMDGTRLEFCDVDIVE